MSKAPVKLKMENGVSEYFHVDRKDLPSLVRATEGRVADWDEFTHLLLEDEFWSCNWRKIEVHDPYLIFDDSSFNATDQEGFDCLTASANPVLRCLRKASFNRRYRLSLCYPRRPGGQWVG